MILKYHHTDKGFCRVCFTTKGKINPKNEYYYCLQEEGNDVKMYRCSNTSQDAPWEPEYSVTFTGPVDILLPAVGDYSEYTDLLISRWEEERKHDQDALDILHDQGELEDLMDTCAIPFPEGYIRINKSGFPRIVWIDNNGGYLTYAPTQEESDKYQRMKAF